MDCFAELGLPARPKIDEEVLKENFFVRAAALHPDAPGGDAEKFQDLQTARKTLWDPTDRLRHLRELRFPGVVPGEFRSSGDLFEEVGGAVRRAGEAVRKHSAAGSALARAVAAGKAADALAAVRKVREQATSAEQALVKKLDELDARWPGVEAAELDQLASAWKFMTRWQQELAEWEFRLGQIWGT